MVDWPGTPSAPAQQWPGQPSTPNQQVSGRWPGTPAAAPQQQAAPTETGQPRLRITPQGAPPSVSPETEDHGYVAETKRAAGHALDALKKAVTIPTAEEQRESFGLRVPLDIGRGVLAIPELAASPITGAVRSFGGRGLQAIDEASRAGIEKLTGKPLSTEHKKSFEDMAGAAETTAMVLPGLGMAKSAPGATSALTAARNAAKTIEKIFSPETVDADAKNAAATIREFSGQAARHTAITEQSIEKGWKTINAMPAQDRLDFMDYVEGRSTKHANTQLPPQTQDLADKLRTAFQQRMAKLMALPKHAQQAFIDDYFPHFWKEPGAAPGVQLTQASGGAGKQGSGASLKARTIPTIADGIAHGLTPVTDNPLEATMRYVTSMDRFIASEAVMQTAKDQGMVRFIRPKVMGASGHPDSFKVPDGWAPLKGRGSTDATGAQAYAPEGFARVYNNFISRGIAEIDPALGDAYEMARRGTNAITGLELGLSGYHALTMMQEGVVNDMANAVKLLRTGHPVQAVKKAGGAFAAPITRAIKGKKVQDVYLGLSPGSRELQKTVDLLTSAGGRAKGATHAPDYNFSKTGSYWTAFKRGALRLQAIADLQEMKARPITGTIKVAAKQIGRIMDTVAQPLFEKYIPLLKNGAFHENMSLWLKEHPTATQEEQTTAARQIWDSVDNRFGELVQDNIFMNKLMKQVGMLTLRSWSWAIGGDIREIGGGIRDIVRAPFKKPTGTGPNEGRWTQKMDYVIALPIVYGTLSAIYQGLKTGKPPESVQDLMAPRTGGVDASTGEPERLIMPGYMKDVFGFYEHPVEEATNKIGTGPKMVGQLMSNRDWRDDPIFNANDSAPQWLKQFFDYAVQNTLPISVRGVMQGPKEGSNLNPVESALGVRTAPRYLTDPEGYEQMMQSIHGRQWKTKVGHDRKQQRLYGGNE